MTSSVTRPCRVTRRILFLASKSVTKGMESLPPYTDPQCGDSAQQARKIQREGLRCNHYKTCHGCCARDAWQFMLCVRLLSEHSRSPSQHDESEYDAIHGERCEDALADIAHEPRDRAVGDDEGDDEADRENDPLVRRDFVDADGI